MFRTLLTASLLTLSAAAFAQTAATRVTLHPGENTVNLTLAPTTTQPTVAAARATCQELRAHQSRTIRTQEICAQAGTPIGFKRKSG